MNLMSRRAGWRCRRDCEKQAWPVFRPRFARITRRPVGRLVPKIACRQFCRTRVRPPLRQSHLKRARKGPFLNGGAGGIRTLDTAFQPYNGLANRRLQPLGHSTIRTSAALLTEGLYGCPLLRRSTTNHFPRHREGRPFALDCSLAQGGLSPGKWRNSGILHPRPANLLQRGDVLALPACILGRSITRMTGTNPAGFARSSARLWVRRTSDPKLEERRHASQAYPAW